MKIALKKILSITLVLSLLLVLNACDEPIKSETGISSLSAEDLSDEDFYSGVNHGSYELDVISSKEYDENSIRVVVEDSSIIDVTYEYTDDLWFTGFNFDINCLKAGNTSFYFETIDSVIKSDPIEISVQENVTAITLNETDEITIYSWQDDETVSFDYESAHYISEIENTFTFVSENPEIVTFEYDKNGSWLSDYAIITPVGSGETYVYIQTKDGLIQSPKLKVIVPEEETESYYDETEDDYDYEYEEEQDNSRTVYITPTGKKYHYSKSCAGKNAIETSENDAKFSHDPCKKCAQ